MFAAQVSGEVFSGSGVLRYGVRPVGSLRVVDAVYWCWRGVNCIPCVTGTCTVIAGFVCYLISLIGVGLYICVVDYE